MSKYDNRIHSYLVQRGTIKKYGETYNTFSLLDFVDLDGMGAAEFEWGAIPNALHTLAENTKALEITKTDIKSFDGKTVYIFSMPKVVENIKEMIGFETDKNHLRTTKCSTFLYEVINKQNYLSDLTTNFWWDIDYGFIILLGDDNMAYNFNLAFNNSVENIKAFDKLPTKEQKQIFIEKIQKDSKTNKEELQNINNNQK